MMEVTYDPEKDATNLQKHGISLERAVDFDFLTAITSIDDSQDYGEIRYIALGFLNTKLHTMIFTEVDSTLHVISLRKSEPSERKRYAED